MIPELNVDQAKAEELFVDFLFSNEKEMKLIGPGGTGKSYLVSKLITRSLKMYQENSRILGIEPEFEQYALTALTNKAAQELSDATGLEVSTLHSFLSLTVRPNFNTGETELKRTQAWTIKERLIIFVDEAFMMDKKLLEEFRVALINCKIVFIGDDKQLDPVDSSHSPISDLNVPTATLTIPVRNASNPDGTPAPPHLRDLCDLFRQNVADQVATNGNAAWPRIPIVPGYIDHVDDTGLQSVLDNEFLVPNGRKVILAFSNDRVNKYNNYIRELRGQSHLFEPGEALISNDLFERNRFRIKNEATVVIETADTSITMLKLGDLDVPTQYVTVTQDPTQRIPVIVDRDFHRQAIKYVQKRAKTKQEDWQRYFALKNDFADFRPRDASTIHKAQGSTKDLVVIDLNDIGSCNFTVMTARMLYVAFSRARYRIILYGNLPSKYGGIIT